jgi:PAS domain S-box-containing protein
MYAAIYLGVAQTVINGFERSLTFRHTTADYSSCQCPLLIEGALEMGKPADEWKRSAKKSRSKRRIAEQTAADVLEHMPEAVVTLNHEWRYMYVNRAGERIARRSREEMLGRTIREIVPESAAQLETACRRALEERAAVHFEEYYAPRDVWFEDTVYPFGDCVSVWLRDITERKRTGDALRKSEERFRSYFELGLIGMAITSPTKGIIEVNDHICKILGYERSELLQLTWAELTYPDDLSADVQSFNRVIAGEIDGYSIDKRWIRKDGQVINATISVKCLRKIDGSVDYFLALLQDVTDHKRTYEALRASEERLRLLVESAEDYAIITLDTEGRVSGWSSGAMRMFGYAEVEIIGRSGEILFTPEDRELGIPVEEMKRAREEGRASGERYYLRKDRTILFASGVTAVLRDHKGQGYVKIARDLTERRQAEEALRRAHEESEQRVIERTRELTILNEELKKEIAERKRAQEKLRRSEAYLAEAQRLSHTGSWAWNASTGELFWSTEHFRIFGIAPSEVAPPFPSVVQYIHPEDRSFTELAFDGSLREGSDFEVTYRVIRPDGTIRHIHSLAHPVFDEQGTLVEYVGTIVDVTERKRTELKLRESERRFRLLLESIPHHVWSFRIDGSLAYWNQRLIDYTGLTIEELRQGGWGALHPDDIEPVRQAWAEASSKGEPYEQEQRMRGHDGRYRRFLCRGVPAPDESGKVVEWFGTDTDIEDLRRAEETLRAVQTELAHMARVTTMGELAASIAHEVNQPLTAVVANGNACVRWLARDPPNLEEAYQALVRIIKEAIRASEVVNRIRTFLKRSAPEKVSLDINELIRDTIALVSSEITRSQMHLETDLVPDISPVLGDRIQLQQVILNLLMNAIEANSEMNAGPREILMTSQQPAPDQVVVAVRDSGVGIEGTNLEQVFNPFFTTKLGGMGMGLSISRSLVEAHGGRLWAIQNDRHGATFEFFLPAHTAD